MFKINETFHEGYNGCWSFIIQILLVKTTFYHIIITDLFFVCLNLVKALSLPKLECRKFEWITDADRSINYHSKSKYKCDQNVFRKNTWFRFGGSAGSSMPTSPPPTHRCGGRSPGWVKDAHPTKINQQKSVTVCFFWPPRKICHWTQKIKVTKCKGFFVYQLKPAPTCFLRYCGNGKKGIAFAYQFIVMPHHFQGTVIFL